MGCIALAILMAAGFALGPAVGVDVALCEENGGGVGNTDSRAPVVAFDALDADIAAVFVEGFRGCIECVGAVGAVFHGERFGAVGPLDENDVGELGQFHVSLPFADERYGESVRMMRTIGQAQNAHVVLI